MSKVATGVKKYITIPESYPLHALGRIYGPKMGPLDKPTPVPVPVIGELLHQTGKEKVTIYEVKVAQTDNKTGKILKFSEPVKLTLENYALSYDEIVNGKTNGAPVVATISEPTKVIVEPTIVEQVIVKAEPIVDPVVVTESEPVAAPVEESVVEAAPAEPEADVVETVQPEEQVERAVDQSDSSDVEATPENLPWPNITPEELEEYNKMSKAEKKQARRAHREN